MLIKKKDFEVDFLPITLILNNNNLVQSSTETNFMMFRFLLLVLHSLSPPPHHVLNTLGSFYLFIIRMHSGFWSGNTAL